MNDDIQNYKINALRKEVDSMKSQLKDFEKIFVKLERYVIFEKGVLAIYITLSLAAFGLLWELAKNGSP